MQKTLFIIFFLFLGVFQTQGQGQFALHVDKPFYVTGENIWYKLYLPSTIKNEVAIKGILVNASGEATERFFIKSDPNQSYVDGFLKIPFNYNSGMYRLEFRATNNPSDPEVILTQLEFPIYNDFDIKALAEKLDAAPKQSSSSKADLSDLKINITLDNSSYSKRSPVNANISITDASGNPVEADFSVAAYDESLVEQALPNAPSFAFGESFNQSQLDGLKENIFVKGVVMDTFNQPRKANVLGAYASLQKRIHYGKTDNNGIFTFKIPDFYGSQTVQFIGYPKETEEIRVKLIPEVDAKQAPKGEVPITEALLKYLEVSQQKKKMAEHFENLKAEITMEEVDNEFKGLKADFTYVADNYIKFENIGDFFGELITPLKFRIVKGKYQARMENPTARDASMNNLPGKPLFIIDGKFTRNADFIARTSWANVKTVDIFYIAEKLRKQFNILGQGGVVRIETDIPQFDLPPNDLEDVFTIYGLKPKGEFVPFQPRANAEIRIPNFNMPTFWSPNQKTDKKGAATVSYAQGDDESTFVICVFAKSADGKMGYATKTYTVDQ